MVLQANEADRMRALRELNLLNTAPSESFDRITRMASQLFGAPISAVSLTDDDRQWFKSRVGCGTEIPRDKAPCAEVTRTNDLLVVSDLSLDPRFEGGILAKSGVRFYAGAPLTTSDGFTLGAMCVLDNKPREITDSEAKILTDLAAMVMAQVELQHALGRIDPSSGLPNRNQFAEDLDDMGRDHAGEQRVAVLIDLADSGRITQAMRVLGTSYLDQLIKVSANELKNQLGTTTLYHVGATQFAVVFADRTEESLRANIVGGLERLADATRRQGLAGMAGATVGLASFVLGEMAGSDVLRVAHSAAQDARDTDLNIGSYSAATDEVHHRRYYLIAGLREALTARDQLSMVYQPRVDLRSGRCEGAEALLRWHHPVLGNVPPGEFIPLAEQTELARPVTAWIVASVLAQIAAWRRIDLKLKISINVSAANLEEEDFSARIAAALDQHGVPTSALEIEFTESALIRNRSRVLKNLGDIRALGVICAIDDFGTGYSSFSYLQDIPAEVIKIDQSFIRTLAQGSRGSALVRNMISMARELGYRVVAEGVETEEAYDFLAASSCDEAQGYLLSRPIAPDAFLAWVNQRNSLNQEEAA